MRGQISSSTVYTCAAYHLQLYTHARPYIIFNCIHMRGHISSSTVYTCAAIYHLQLYTHARPYIIFKTKNHILPFVVYFYFLYFIFLFIYTMYKYQTPLQLIQSLNKILLKDHDLKQSK